MATKAIYRIGTDHRYQRGYARGLGPAPLNAFRDMLKAEVVRRDIQGIAEEMSLEGLHPERQSGSVGFHLASELGLSHRYCDPDRATRMEASINSDTERELYWLQQLLGFDAYPAMFICGANHIASFTQLLSASGFHPTILVRDWEPPIEV